MTELTELYRETVLDHNSRPRNYKKLEEANHTAEGYNPLCGDRISLYLQLDGEIISDIGFQGRGCAISRAAASLMTVSVKGKTVAEATGLFKAFHGMLTRGVGREREADSLGDLEALAGVADFPARVKCASLPWHTFNAALEDRTRTVKTE